MRVIGGGSEGDDAHLKKLDRVFWAPRVTRPTRRRRLQEGRRGKPSSRCSATSAIPSSTAAPRRRGEALVDTAMFYKARWIRYAYSLARDDTGKYYYVDDMRDPSTAQELPGVRRQEGRDEAAEDDQRRRRLRGRHLLDEDGLLAPHPRQARDHLDAEREEDEARLPRAVRQPHHDLHRPRRLYGEPLGTPCDDL